MMEVVDNFGVYCENLVEDLAAVGGVFLEGVREDMISPLGLNHVTCLYSGFPPKVP